MADKKQFHLLLVPKIYGLVIKKKRLYLVYWSYIYTWNKKYILLTWKPIICIFLKSYAFWMHCSGKLGCYIFYFLDISPLMHHQRWPLMGEKKHWNLTIKQVTSTTETWSISYSSECHSSQCVLLEAHNKVPTGQVISVSTLQQGRAFIWNVSHLQLFILQTCSIVQNLFIDLIRSAPNLRNKRFKSG